MTAQTATFSRRRMLHLGSLGAAAVVLPSVLPHGTVAARADMPVESLQPDWRARPLMTPDPTKTAFGFSPSVGTIDELETVWGSHASLARVYGGVLASLIATMATCQSHLAAGRIAVLDLNTSASFSAAGFVVDDVNHSGKSLWQQQAEGFFDADGVGPNGQAYKGFDSMLLAIKGLTKGLCPTNRIMLSKDHEMEDMNEGGGDGKTNGDAVNKSSGTPAEFRSAWQHMRARADALGVENILWFMDGAAGVGRWGEELTDTGSNGFYPGHRYVDFVAWDPYNAAGIREAKWRHFNDGPDGMLNKFGQMDWWRRNFKVGGKATQAAVTGSEGVYKPAMLAEFGTVDSWTSGTGTQFTAAGWAQGMVDFQGDPRNQGILRWLIYFNNSNMTLLNAGSFRRAEFGDKGTRTIFQ